MKKTLGLVAAVLLAFFVLSPPAEAHCWWNGYRWHCANHRYHHHHVRYGRPYAYYGYYPYPYYYRPYYVCVPFWPFCG